MSQVAALFDLDRTLLDTSSGSLYAQFQYRNGQMSRWQLLRVIWWSTLSQLGLLKMESLIPRLLSAAAGDDEAETRTLCARWFVDDVMPHVADHGVRRVEEHLEQGHVVAIVSASTQYVVEPMAVYLNIPGQYVCTHLESKDGTLTGQIRPPACYSAGKVVWAERFAAERNVDLAASYFYTDSISDLPLLERVGHPVAINPDPRLLRKARQRGWPIEEFY